MNLVLVVLLQVAFVVAVVELLVYCMPSSLRKASHQNCFRIGGMRSDRRTAREARARSRLRRDIWPAMVLVMLIGTIMYFVLDGMIAPVSSLSTRVSQAVASQPESSAVNAHHDAVIEAGQKGKLIDSEQFNLRWPLIIVLVAAWLVISFLVMARVAMLAYKSFSEGVAARTAEYFQLDMSRMSITDSQLVHELLGASDKSSSSNKISTKKSQ